MRTFSSETTEANLLEFLGALRSKRDAARVAAGRSIMRRRRIKRDVENGQRLSSFRALRPEPELLSRNFGERHDAFLGGWRLLVRCLLAFLPSISRTGLVGKRGGRPGWLP